MGEIRDRTAKLNIRVASADGGVTGRLSMREGIRLESAPEPRDRYDEGTLARAVEETLRALAAGRRRVGDLIRKDNRQGRPPEAPDSPTAHRRAELDEALAGIGVEAESPDGYLTIRRFGQNLFTVDMRPGALGRLDRDQLAREVNATVRAVSRDFSRQAQRAPARLHDSDNRDRADPT